MPLSLPLLGVWPGKHEDQYAFLVLTLPIRFNRYTGFTAFDRINYVLACPYFVENALLIGKCPVLVVAAIFSF